MSCNSLFISYEVYLFLGIVQVSTHIELLLSLLPHALAVTLRDSVNTKLYLRYVPADIHRFLVNQEFAKPALILHNVCYLL